MLLEKEKQCELLAIAEDKESILFLKDFLFEFEAENQYFGRYLEEEWRFWESGQNISKKNQLPPNPPQTLNGQKWLLNMMKAFHNHETFDGMKFLELWINYIILKWSFFKTKFETAMNIIETVFDEFESEIKKAIQIPLQQMAFILNSTNISINKYQMLVTVVQQHLSETKFKALNCFPEVKDVKNEIQKLEQKVTNLFELNENCSKEQKIKELLVVN